MSRSADASGARDASPWCDVQRSLYPDISAVTEPCRAASVGGQEDTALLEVVLPVYAKLGGREELHRRLGISVHTGRGALNGVSRVRVRLTDPTDAFFLFELELLEDDYDAFKQRLELRVDFSGFPKYLVSMLNDVFNGAVPYIVSFAIDSVDAAGGTLRVLERTEFRTVEHISLKLIRQGDAGQKRYLAERFRHFERAYTREVEEHLKESMEAATSIEALKSEVALLREECASIREKRHGEVLRLENSRKAELSKLREEHASEISRLRATLESELRHVTQIGGETQKQLRDSLEVKERDIDDARRTITSLESIVAELRSELRSSKEALDTQTRELDYLRSSNQELQDFRSDATRSLSDNKLNYVTLQERLRGVERELKAREKEYGLLRDQCEKQDNYVRTLESQNKQLFDQKSEKEASLSKAHYIISNQVKRKELLKTRERAMRKQLANQEKLIQEKNNTITNLRNEVSSSTEKLKSTQNKVDELRSQLEKTDDTREKLSKELKQTQDALIHLQRSTSVSGRHWSIGTTCGLNSSSAAPFTNGVLAGLGRGSESLDVYKELHKNGSNAVRNFRYVSPHGSDGISSPMPKAFSTTANGVLDSRGNDKKVDFGHSGLEEHSHQNEPSKKSSNDRANGASSNTTLITGGSGSAVSSERNKFDDKLVNGQSSKRNMNLMEASAATTSTVQLFPAKNFFASDHQTAALSENASTQHSKGLDRVAVGMITSAYF